jgi:enterochelin esterase-like enzyme
MRWLPVSFFLALFACATAATTPTSASRVEEVMFFSPALGRQSPLLVYLPAGYESGSGAMPVVYLLHGRGDNLLAWLEARGVLDDLIAAGTIPPVIAVMPDAPSSRKAGFYIDSRFTGTKDLPAGEAVETALAHDLPAFIDRKYRTLAAREGRLVAGYSMGGFGAVRFAFAHADRFAAAIVLSPALYLDLPPEDSSMRTFGAFGAGAKTFDGTLYGQLSQPWRGRTAASPPLKVFLAVGDDERVRDSEFRSLTSDATDLHRVMRGVPAIEVQLRVFDGGHDWRVWRPGLRDGLIWLLGRT